MEEQKVHKFERAGLGKAPFVYLGSYEDRGPHNLGNGVFVGAPGQPMGTCQYCGQGIAICCRGRSADGKEFVVGTDCIMKINDPVLKTAVNAEKTKLRHKSEDMRIVKGREFIESYRDRLYGRKWCEEDRYTIMESFDWYMVNAGRAGKLRIIKSITKHIQELFPNN